MPAAGQKRLGAKPAAQPADQARRDDDDGEIDVVEEDGDEGGGGDAAHDVVLERPPADAQHGGDPRPDAHGLAEGNAVVFHLLSCLMAKESYRPSSRTAPRARRRSSSVPGVAMPVIRLFTPAVSARPYLSSFRSMSWTISPIAVSAGPTRPAWAIRTSKVQRSPLWVTSPSNMSKRSSPGSRR